MNQGLHHRLREEDLAFFGRIGADVSHDMRNVLSIIGEYAGLLDDLLGLSENGRPLDYAKLRGISANISRQVREGTELMGRFSRFAHAADEPTASFDLTELTRNVAALARRHVTLAGCTLEVELPDGAIPVSANPFRLQHAVFSVIQLILEFLEKGKVATIRLVAYGPAAVISVSGNATTGCGELSGRIVHLSAVMNELKGNVKPSRTDGVLALNLSIPIR